MAGTVILMLKMRSPKFGFPSAVGQSLTYSIYENDNRASTLTQTVTDLFLRMYVVEVKVSDSRSMRLYVKNDGRIKSLLDEIRLLQPGGMWTKSRLEWWCLRYTANIIFIHTTIISGENRSSDSYECSMPENFVCKWEDLYFRFGKEPLSLEYSKRFNFVDKVIENFPEPDIGGIITSVTFTSRTAKVIREEHLTVPAGGFDCYVVEISGEGVEEDLFIWVDKQLGITVQWRRGAQAAKLENYSGF
jgi:hypothetical protein